MAVFMFCIFAMLIFLTVAGGVADFLDYYFMW